MPQDDTVEILNGDTVSGSFLTQLSTMFAMAALVSPLTLLYPKKYPAGFPPAQIICVSRNKILYVCYALMGGLDSMVHHW